mgnify:CR=1 FL=1
MPRRFGQGNAGRPPKNKRTPCFSDRTGTGKKRRNMKRLAVKLSQEQDWEGNSIYDTARDQRRSAGKTIARKRYKRAVTTTQKPALSNRNPTSSTTGTTGSGSNTKY